MFFTSCYNYNARKKLARAESLLAQNNPDSSLKTLDSIVLTENMGKKYYMQYVLMHLHAKYKAYKDVKRDTAVFEAVRYYEKENKDFHKMSLANYLAGCVLREQMKYKESIRYFKRALFLSIKTKNYTQQGLINENLGFLYENQLYAKQAIIYYKNAYHSYSKQAGNEKKQISVLTILARDFLVFDENDSAVFYFTRVLTLADSLKDSTIQASARNNIGIAYQSKAKYEQSNEILKEAFQFKPDNEITKKLNLNLATNYLSQKKYDLAEKYIPEMERSISRTSDLYYKSAATTFLKEFEKQKKNFEKSLKYAEENSEIQLKILSSNQSQTLIAAEKEFDYSQKEAETEKAKLMQRNTVIVSALLVIILMLMAFILRRRHIQKQKQKEAELFAEQRIKELENKTLEQRLKQYEYTHNQYKTLIKYTNALNSSVYQIAEQGWYKENSGHFEQIIRELQSTETAMIANMSETARIFFREQSLLVQILDSLSDDDIVLLYMLFIKEARKDIAALLNIKTHTLTQRVSRLKDKLITHLRDNEFQAFFQ